MNAILKEAFRLATQARPGGTLNVSGWRPRASKGDKHKEAQDRAIAEVSTIENIEDAARMVYDFYKGNMLPYLDKLPAESVDEFQDRPGKRTLWLMKAIVDTVARTYDTTPIRAVTGDDMGFLQWVSDVGYNAKCRMADRLGTAQGNGAWRLVWNTKTARIDLDWIRKESLRIVEGAGGEIEAAVIRWSFTREGQTVDKAIIYTNDEIVTLTNGAEDKHPDSADHPRGPNGKGFANPYGFIPLVFYKYDILATSYHCDGVGQYTAESNAELNNRLSAAAFNSYMQSFTPIVEKDNRDADSDQKYGPGSIWSISGEGASVFPIPLDSHLTELMQFLRDDIREMLYTLRIPEQAIIGTADASGVAIVAASAPLMEMRRDGMDSWLPVEIQVFEKFKAITAEHTNRQPTKSSMSVLWPDPAVNMTVADKILRTDWEISHGLTDLISIELERNASAYAHIKETAARETAASAAIAKRKLINRTLMGGSKGNEDDSRPEGNRPEGVGADDGESDSGIPE